MLVFSSYIIPGDIKTYQGFPAWGEGGGRGGRESDRDSVGQGVGWQEPHFYRHVGRHIRLSPNTVWHTKVRFVPAVTRVIIVYFSWEFCGVMKKINLIMVFCVAEVTNG